MVRLLILLLLSGVPGALAADAEAPASLAGRWTGTIAESTLADAVAGGQATLELRPNTGGFALVWQLAGKTEIEASFEPAPNRPGLYQVASGGLMSMFGSDTPIDPLAGGQLLWARTDGPTLVVYGLTIANGGGFSLDRAAFRREGDALAVSVSERRQGEQHADLATTLRLKP